MRRYTGPGLGPVAGMEQAKRLFASLSAKHPGRPGGRQHKMVLHTMSRTSFLPGENVVEYSHSKPDRLVRAMQNSTHVISAWDGDRLIGLMRALSDEETVAFLHYFLVDPAYQGKHIGDELMKRILRHFENLLYVKVMPSDPKTISFYERYGFRQYDNYSAMVLKHFS